MVQSVAIWVVLDVFFVGVLRGFQGFGGFLIFCFCFLFWGPKPSNPAGGRPLPEKSITLRPDVAQVEEHRYQQGPRPIARRRRRRLAPGMPATNDNDIPDGSISS